MAKICFGTVKQRLKKGVPKTKWWKLKDETTKLTFVEAVKERLGESLPLDWGETSRGIRVIAKEVLGVTTGRTKGNKETWWWNSRVQEALKKKKEARKDLNRNGEGDPKVKYKLAKQEAKREVAKAKHEAYQEMYDRLETVEGQKDIF